MARSYELDDRKWEKLKEHLPGKKGDVGVTAKDNRKFVEGVLYRYRTGIPWRDLPEKYGDFRVVHTRFSRWSKKGVWERVFKILSQDKDDEYEMIDSTTVRAHQHSAGAASHESQAIGRSAGGLSTKIHAITDALGNPTGFFLTPGQAHDLQGADVLLPQTTASIIIADKAYDAEQRVIQPLIQRGKVPLIPSKTNRKLKRNIDKHLYGSRHLIENFFAKLKQFRAIATRYDKLARNFLSAIFLAASIIWLV